MIGLLTYLAASPLLMGSMMLSGLPAANAISVPNNNLHVRHAPAGHHAAAARRYNEMNQIVGRDAETPRVKRRTVKKRAGQTCRINSGNGNSTISVSSSSTIARTTATATATASTAAAVSSSTSSSVASSSSSVWVAPSSSSSAAPAASPNALSVSVSVSAGSGGSTNSGSKLGVAWPNGDWAQSGDANYIGNYIGSKTSWYYNWNPNSVSSGDNHGLEFCPMIWGAKDANDGWWTAVNSWPSSVKHVLFFNEPNDGGQSNIGAADSVQYWQTYMSPLKAKGYKLGMAATTSATSGLQWVLDFKAACPSCWNEVDFVPIHYYYTHVEDFKTYVTKFYNSVQKPLWVTEYACQNFAGGAQCTWDETMDFHYQMAAFFDSSSFVERYSPFGVMTEMQGVNQDNALMNPDGSITALGTWYIYNA